MHKLSIAALLIAALALSSPALAQVSVETGVGGNVSASAGGVDVNASTSAGASGGVSSNSSGVDVGASTSASASGGGNGNGGSGSGGASASASGEAGNSSSGASGSTASSGEGSSSAMEKNCTNVNAGAVSTGALDAANLSAVTEITVFSTLDCSGLESLTNMDAGAQAALGANEMVAKAIVDAGYQGQQVVGYMLDGTSLTVYVKK